MEKNKNLQCIIEIDGRFSLLYKGKLLLTHGYPGIDGEPIRPLAVQKNPEGTGVKWETVDGTISMEVVGKEDSDEISLQYRLCGFQKPIHMFWPLHRAQTIGVGGCYHTAWGLGGEAGFLSYEKLKELGGMGSHGLGCLQYPSVEKALAIYPAHQEKYEAMCVMEAKQLLSYVPLSYRGDPPRMLMGKEDGMEFGFCYKIEGVNAAKEGENPEMVFSLPALSFAVCDNVEQGLEYAAKQIGAAMGARLLAPPAYHWCSWYYCYHNFDMPQLREYLDGLNTLTPKVPVRYVQIDAGYFPSAGDWLLPTDRFPEGLEPAFRMIREAGYEPGIWIGPFMVGNRSRLYAEHPDWMLYDLEDRPVRCWVTDNEPKPWGYQDEEYYVLDTSHPEAMAYMKEVFTAFSCWGARLIKTDFMVWGMQDSTKVKRHTPGKTSMEYFREFLQMIREVMGEETYWLGCIAPFVPFIGYADGMRIGNDVGSSWDGGFGPKNMLMSLIGNNYANHNYYQTDPDAIMIRDFQIRLTEEEVESLALLAAVSGGCVYTSDPLHRIGNDRLELFRYIEPDMRRKPMLPLLEQEREELVLVHRKNEKGRGLLFVLNPLDRVWKEEYKLTELGFEETDLAINLRSAEKVPVRDGAIFVNLAPHACGLYLISDTEVTEIAKENLWKNL